MTSTPEAPSVTVNGCETVSPSAGDVMLTAASALAAASAALAASAAASTSAASTSAASKHRSTKTSLLFLQSWLEQFSRTNGGASLSDYSSEYRVRLLQTLQSVVEAMFISDHSSSFKAAICRVIVLSAEEMSRHFDVIPSVQQPCSKILVRIGRGDPENRQGQVGLVSNRFFVVLSSGRHRSLN